MVGRNTLAWVLLCTVLIAGDFVAGQDELQCMECICEASSGCDRSAGCDGDVCGAFKITRPYWSDAGEPMIPGDGGEGAFERCALDETCARDTVDRYMTRFARDCNGDNVINCQDIARIHRLGPFGCSAPLDFDYQSRLDQCLQG